MVNGKPPEYHGGSMAQHAADWETVDLHVQTGFWFLGAIAASLEGGYGSGAVEEFAKEVGKSSGRIYQLARTYRAFQGADISPELTFTHYQIAAESSSQPDPKPPEYWIRHALENELSTRKLEDAIKGKRLPEFRLHEEPVDAEVRPVTETGYSKFPPDEDAPYEAVVGLEGWKHYVRSHPCYSCAAGLNVEAAHIECLPSKKHSGLIPRRNGLGEWPCLPLCANCHRIGADSVHSLGEDSFFNLHRGKDHAVGYICRLLLEFFTEDE